MNQVTIIISKFIKILIKIKQQLIIIYLFIGKLGEIKTTASNLKDVSMAAAGLKALASVITVEGIEECRKMCGGYIYYNYL